MVWKEYTGYLVRIRWYPFNLIMLYNDMNEMKFDINTRAIS